MRERISIGLPESTNEFAPSRRAALTRLARIAQACGAFVLFGFKAQKAYASGNLGSWWPADKIVDFDGSGKK